MACINIIAADTVEEAQYLSLSHFQQFVNILTDQRQPLLPPEETQLDQLSNELTVHLNRMTAKTFIGNKATLTEKLAQFVKLNKLDEVIVSCNIYDYDAKLHSYEIAAEVLKSI